MAFDPSIFANVSSRVLNASCCPVGEDAPTEELTFTPELLYFAYVLEGETSDAQTFTIQNTGDLPVGLASVTVTGDFEITGVVPTSLVPGASCSFQITFSPSTSGARVGDVIIDAGTTGPQSCVHLIGVGGEDTFTTALAAIEARVIAAEGVNSTQAAEIIALQNLLAGYVSETPVYMWRAYANSPDGNTDFTTGEPGNRSFIGLAFNKLSAIPSEDSDDYEWSTIGVTIGNVISYDTTNVAGRPATQIITDLDALALQILAYQYDRQQLRDYVDALLYVDGEPVNAEIISLQNIVETADEALAEELHILGAKSEDGLSFILDMNKVYVSPELSLGVRIGQLVTETATAAASVLTLQEAIAEANYASATDLALLGAKTLDGTAFVLSLDTVLVDGGGSLASHIDSVVAAAAGGAASVTEIYEATITPEGGAAAKAVLQLDVDGYVSSMALTNGGGTSDVTFTFDSFNIIHPGDLTPVFSVVGGVVKMTNVEIDTLKVNSVLSESILPGAVTEKVIWEDSFGAVTGNTLGNAGTGTWAAFGQTGEKAEITTSVLPANAEMCLRFYCNMKQTGSDSDRVWFRLRRTAVVGGATVLIGDTIQSGMGKFPAMLAYEWIDYPPAAVAYTYSIEYYRDTGNGTYYNAKLIADVGKR